MNKAKRQSETGLLGSKAHLDMFAQKLSKSRALKAGIISFSLTGPEGGDYFIDCTAGKAQVHQGTSPKKAVFEMIGDARRIQEILAGKKDASKQFLAGGFRIRGDLRYLSDLALELGIIGTPM